MRGWVNLFLLLVCMTLSAGLVALTVAWFGYQFGVAGWAVVAVLGGWWVLSLLLAREYPPAPGQGHEREESKYE